MIRPLALSFALAAAAVAAPSFAADDETTLRADLIVRGYVVQPTQTDGELLVFVGDDVVLVKSAADGVAYSAHLPGATEDTVDAAALAEFNAAAEIGEASFDEEGYLVLRHVRDGAAANADVAADLEALGRAVGRLKLAAGR